MSINLHTFSFATLLIVPVTSLSIGAIICIASVYSTLRSSEISRSKIEGDDRESLFIVKDDEEDDDNSSSWDKQTQVNRIFFRTRMS